MVHNFYGIPCTPRALNQWLQAHNGYAARPYATITDVLGQGPGDVLRYKNVSAVDTLIAGNQFLIERAVHEPLVTAQVSAVPTRSADGRATILQRYLPDPIVSGALGKVYSLAVNAAVGDRFSGGTWTLRQNGRQVDSCERAMAGGSPVLLYVRRRGACGHHWVVGDGRDAAFVADNVARGTYEILDPGYDFHRLLDGSNTNHFWDCRSCVRKSFGNPNTARSTGAGTDASMMLVLNGPAFLTVADSLGEEIDYDSQSDSYVSGVPDAIALRGWVDDDDVDGTETSGAIDVIELPVAASSSLTVRLTGQATGSFGLVAQAYSGSVAGSDAVTGECSGGAKCLTSRADASPCSSQGYCRGAGKCSNGTLKLQNGAPHTAACTLSDFLQKA